ncbi:hypothetical protein BGZ47_004862 [Haplosporangium gracile]|nr:hypothetical protein BGZ47_004862 [Haplosporangium gracile]
MIPEIIALVGQHLSLFVHRFDITWDRDCVTWNPKTLLDAAAVCKTWRSVLVGVLWNTYDRVLMKRTVPLKVLVRNMHLVRRLSLLNEYTMRSEERASFQQAIRRHQHISCLEVFEEVFHHQRLSMLNAESLSELKLTGSGGWVGSAMMVFVESLHNLRCLELAQYKFTRTDWKRFVTGKPHLRKLVVLEKGVYNEGTVVSGLRRIKQAPRRDNIVLEDAADIGTLPITHLPVQLFSARVHLSRISEPEATGNLSPKGGKKPGYAELIGDHCQELEVLTVHNKHMIWTQTMVRKMPQTVQELALHLEHSLLDVAGAIAERGASLARLELDFVNGFKNLDNRHLSDTKALLRGCSGLQEFVYHHHIHDRFFTCALLKVKWNLPHLNTLRLHGLDPYCRSAMNRETVCKDAGPQIPTTVPLGWRGDVGGSLEKRSAIQVKIMAIRNIATRLITRTFASSSVVPQKGTRPFQVAIDGPAASGKSTTAKMVAQRLGFDYIDTGAFYRCVTLAALSKGIDPSNPSQASQISNLAESSHIGLKTVFSTSSSASKSSLPTTRVFLDSKDVSFEIRTGTVSKHVSAVAAIGPVREAVLHKVRNMGVTSISQERNSGRDGLVMDGRDIGTVVLPNADLKIFLVADSRVRAERRLQELARSGSKEEVLDVETVQKDLERRDELDRTREVSPLRKADDAVELDTSHLTIEGQVDAIVQEVHHRQQAEALSSSQ